MTKEEVLGRIDVIIQIIQQRMYPKEWRKGQAVFNLFYINFPQKVDKIRGTDKDCFHKEDRVEVFINDILEQFNDFESIKDLEKEAFEAGRKGSGRSLDYLTFEDYLKYKENGTSNSK